MSQNLVWNYFTQLERPVAECNLCQEFYLSEEERNLEEHLTCEHPEVITEIRESIRRADLAECFVFDVGDSEARCKYTDNCIVNIFKGIDYLEDHLRNHVRIDVARTLEREQRNPIGTASQPTTAENNANASNQLIDPLAQNTEYLEELPWSNSDSLVWRYFKSVRKSYVECNICKRLCYGLSLIQLEEHLLCCHKKLIDEIRCEINEEIRRLNLSLYFVCDTELPEIRCKVGYCIRSINIFDGIKRLTEHLYKCHASMLTTIFPYIPRSTTHVMTKSVAETDNVSTHTHTNVDDPKPGPSWQT
jgi:hypothetical protein